MFDDLRSDHPEDNLEETKPRHLPTAKIPTNPFDGILQSAGEDELKLLGPEDLLDWPFFDNKSTRVREPKAVHCVDAVYISKLLRAANLPIRDKLLNSAKNSTPDWLKEDNNNDDLPSWLTASAGDDLFAHKGLPKASRNRIPDWMTEHGQDIDLTAKNGLSDPKEVFDPNQTQKVIAVKKPDPVLVKKGRIAMLVIGVYVVLLNLVFWRVPTGFDNILIDAVGIYLTIYLADMGYDIRNLIPLIKKK